MMDNDIRKDGCRDGQRYRIAAYFAFEHSHYLIRIRGGFPSNSDITKPFSRSDSTGQHRSAA
jgi:hypothetical protein